MADDIPQDQVEAVRQAVSHECGSCLCPRDRHYAKLCRPYNKDGPPCRCEEIAIAAIRSVSPLIAAAERERCAALVERDVFVQAGNIECNYCYARLRAKELVESIRSVKGAVT